MVDLPSERSIIQTPEVTTGAAVSEAVAQKMGATLNLLAIEGRHLHAWKMNGPYSVTGVPDPTVDGVLTAYRTTEIFGFAMYNGFAGSVGDLEIDLILIPASGGPQVTLFTTRPKIPFSAGNDARIVRRLDIPATLVASSGVTVPVFATTILSPGDMVKLNIIAKQTGGSDATVELALRPTSEP